jgi:hypothetical protein
MRPAGIKHLAISLYWDRLGWLVQVSSGKVMLSRFYKTSTATKLIHFPIDPTTLPQRQHRLTLMN